jgi:hypothetical protein
MELELSIAQEDSLDANKVNNGVWVQLDSVRLTDDGDPIPMYLGGDKSKPQRALVRSNRCRQIADLTKTAQRGAFVKMQKAPKSKKDEASAGLVVQPEDKFPIILAALDNMFPSKPGFVQIDEDTAMALFNDDRYGHIVQKITETSFDDTLYAATANTETGDEIAPAPQATKAKTKT